MGTSTVVQLPSAEDVQKAKESSRKLAKYSNAERVQLSIKANNGVSDELILPGHAFQLLLDILSEMSRGNAISVMPIHAELSTQEAANILNVSRPFFVGLLDDGTIAHRKVGSHRRVLVKDVIEYKQEIDNARQQTLDQLAAESQKLGMGYE